MVNVVISITSSLVVLSAASTVSDLVADFLVIEVVMQVGSFLQSQLYYEFKINHPSLAPLQYLRRPGFDTKCFWNIVSLVCFFFIGYNCLSSQQVGLAVGLGIFVLLVTVVCTAKAVLQIPSVVFLVALAFINNFVILPALE